MNPAMFLLGALLRNAKVNCDTLQEVSASSAFSMTCLYKHETRLWIDREAVFVEYWD